MYRFLLFFNMIVISIFCCNNTTAQYFYKDIWNSQQLNKEISLLKNQKIKLISVKSFEEDGEPSEGFFCEEKIEKNYLVSQTLTRSNITSQSLLVSYFNGKGFIIKTVDSTESSLNITEYKYDDKDKLIEITTFAKSNDDPVTIEESHNYSYGTNSYLQMMVRKKNDIEISTITFKTDEKGNVIEEDEALKSSPGKTYFYYYNDKNNLTDVVHYNERAKRLLPDYMYEYSTQGQIKQMITTEEGGGYNTWKYTYNDQQLRETEKCFSKEKKLLGSIQYSYK